MKLLLTGVNHKTAPVELREQLAIAPERLGEATHALLDFPGVHEAMILSTCNRVELLACHESNSPDLLSFLEGYLGVGTASLRPHIYEYRETDAVQHLFRVASSLDSMVVGEPQILGQVKESYTTARSVGAVQTHLEKLLQSTFAVAKKIRTETQIGSSSVSIASVAVDLAKKIFGSLEGKRVLLVGAGKMSELAARHLLQQGADAIYVANRTHDHAVRLAQNFQGRAVRFEDLYATADQADIIITSTGSQEHIFRREHGQQFLHKRRNRPMFFIDIAVPRDIDPEINRVDGVFLYDIDDLQSVAASHLADRAREAQRAEAIIAEEVQRFQRHAQALNATPMIIDLQSSAEEMRQAELRRMQARLQSLTPEQQAAVEALTRGLMNKFLHLPMQAIKAAALEADTVMLEVMRSVFHLTRTQEPANSRITSKTVPAETDEPVIAGNQKDRS
ncbi:glutamyl-tRNA reductase [Alloacidobacterium sp.]|uniref:glutamyl-tRNA reductase n=1 Tax=Alloacidobacterium sp. TaxID=2951999 RepID=UPI002D2B7247|nr:glutamyl-tRNA reductase [Alloacidobacterium sp.]HYK36347.1 glutamyl-tRNA reductase [Alloacidobacterium sp.]